MSAERVAATKFCRTAVRTFAN